MNHDITSTGAQFLARALRKHGVRRVYGLCGDHINALYRALTLEDIEIVGTRTESGAVQMADAEARVSGQLAVAVVTGCPGHTNALTGMSIAQNAQSPVLVISGLTPVDQRDRGGSQVLHQADLARPVTKWALEVPNAAHMAEMVTKAIQIATSGTPGPVSLSVPADVLEHKVSAGRDDPLDHVRPVASRVPLPVQVSLPADSLQQVRKLLEGASRPIVILGTGARRDGSPQRTQAAIERLGMPVFTVDQARGLVPDDGRLCFGYADPLFSRTFRETVGADLVILAGAAIDFHSCFGREQLLGSKVKILQITEDPAQLNQCRQSELAIQAPPMQVLGAVAEAVCDLTGRWSQWLGFIQLRYAENRELWANQCRGFATDATIHPLQLCASLQRHHTPDTGIIIDAGDYVHWARGYFRALAPGRWMDAVLIGNLGGSIPLGIGCQMAHGKGQTWAFIGDGGFGFSSWDLEVAVERKLPLKIILGNDACWGVEKRLQQGAYGADVGCELREIRYDKFAEMMGATAVYVDDVKHLDEAVDRVVAASGPALLNVRIRSGAGRPLADFPRY